MSSRQIENITPSRRILDVMVKSEVQSAVPEAKGMLIRLANGKIPVATYLKEDLTPEFPLRDFDAPTEGYIITGVYSATPHHPADANYWLRPQHEHYLQTFTRTQKIKLQAGEALPFYFAGPEVQVYHLKKPLPIGVGVIPKNWYLVLNVNTASENFELTAYSPVEFPKRFMLL